MKKALSSDAVIPSDEFYNQVGIQHEEAFGHDVGLHKVTTVFNYSSSCFQGMLES